MVVFKDEKVKCRVAVNFHNTGIDWFYKNTWGYRQQNIGPFRSSTTYTEIDNTQSRYD